MIGTYYVVVWVQGCYTFFSEEVGERLLQRWLDWQRADEMSADEGLIREFDADGELTVAYLSAISRVHVSTPDTREARAKREEAMEREVWRSRDD